MANKERDNPYSAFNFSISFLEGAEKARVALEKLGFMECTGLDLETQVLEYRDSKRPSGTVYGAHVRKLPGMESYSNIVLRRGLSGNTELWSWRQQVIKGEPWENIKADIHVQLKDEKNNIVMTWKLFDAWPCKLSGPALDARTNNLAIETLELCVDRIEQD